MQDFMLFCSLASRTISDFALALRCVLCVGFEVCPLCAGFEVCPLCAGFEVCPLYAGFEVCPLCAGFEVCPVCAGFEVCPLCAGFEVCPLSVAVSDTALCLKCDGAVFEVWPLLTLPNLRLNLNGAVFGVFGLF